MSGRKPCQGPHRPVEAFLMCVRFMRPLVTADCCSERDCRQEPPLRIKEPLILDAWLRLRQSIPCFDVSDPNMFSDPRFQAIASDVFMLAKERVVHAWNKHLLDESAWLNAQIPRIDALHHPLFVRRVRVPKHARVYLIGDIHSSLASLLNILADLRDRENAFVSNFALAANHYIVFLGDLVDRGPYSTEVLFLALMLVVANPERVFLINGNHEDCETFSKYGFDRELRAQFGEQWFDAKNVLNYLPSALIVSRGKRSIQLCHGAFTEHLGEQQCIAQLVQTSDERIQFAYLRDFLVNDLCEPSAKRDIDNLKWGDFNGDIPYMGRSKRDQYAGQVREFGYLFARHYLRNLHLDAVVSGHQDLSNFTMLVDSTRASAKIKRESEPDINYPTLRRLRIDEKEPFAEAVLRPGIDFLAANTSTAVQSKGNDGLLSDCYLTLF